MSSNDVILHTHEINVNINNRHANIEYILEFKTIDNEEVELKTEELIFEFTIDPAAFVCSFEANIFTSVEKEEKTIDNEAFIGQIKQKKSQSQSQSQSISKTDVLNGTELEERESVVSIKQIYRDIPNIFEIRADISGKNNVRLSLKISQYVATMQDFHCLTVQLLRNFGRYNITADLKAIPFKLIIHDKHYIDKVQINNDDMKTDLDGTKSKVCKISGQITTESSVNELFVKYKTQKQASCDSYVIYDPKTHAFCHVFTDKILNNLDIANKNKNKNHEILIPRRVMFVIDASGSMKGNKWNRTVTAVTNAIKQLQYNVDRFCVSVFNTNMELIQPFVLADENICASAIKLLKNTHVQKQTNINRTLLQSIKLVRADISLLKNKGQDNFFMSQIIFITDGDPNLGEIDTRKILFNVSKANKISDIDEFNDKISIYTFGLGCSDNTSEWIDDLNHAFIHALAVNNNGFYRRVKERLADVILSQYFDVLSKPILCNISIEYMHDSITDTTRSKYKAFYAGTDLIICGKMVDMDKHSSLQLKISGISGVLNNKSVQQIDVAAEMKLDLKSQAHLTKNNAAQIWAYFRVRQHMTDNIISDNDNKDDLEMSQISFDYKLLSPWTCIEVSSVSDSNFNKPNISRIMSALNNSTLREKYSDNKNNYNLREMFVEFLDNEGFSDDAMEDEFGDGVKADSSFSDFLTDQKGMEETRVADIWDDLNMAFKGEYESYNITPEKTLTAYHRINYNIHVDANKLQWIKQELDIQCHDLLIQGTSGRNREDNNNKLENKLDVATYSMLQIGKQNFNRPILMWLVDAYNRFRIQRRKRFKRKYADPVVYDHKFTDIDPDRFIQTKCRGFTKWLCEYTETQQKHFRDQCHSSINVFFRRLLPKPPMHPRPNSFLISDSIVQIAFYILQCYSFIEQFTQQKNAPLPAQIDVVFIVAQYEMVPYDHGATDDDDDDDDKNNQPVDEQPVDVADIQQRLQNQKHLPVKDNEIEWRMANRTMLQNVNTLIANQHNQRVVLIIDRRKKDEKDKSEKDKIYGFQPTGIQIEVSEDKTKNCYCFESNVDKFLYEALIQNVRDCILPPLTQCDDPIGINHNANPACLTLSFHCFSTTQIQVYLFYNGWGTRFFIEDIKYFLPTFFVKNQVDLLRYTFEQDLNRDFKKKYEKTRRKCKDCKFENFYRALIDGKLPH